MWSAASKGFTILFSRFSSVSTISLFQYLAGGWVGWSEELSELSVINSGVTVGINSSDDGEQLTLGCIVAAASQEGAKVEGVDLAIIILVNGFVGRVGCKVIADLEIRFEDVKSALQFKLLLNNVEQSQLNVTWQRVIAANSARWTVKSDVPQEVVFTWQKHLQETKKGMFSLWSNGR